MGEGRREVAETWEMVALRWRKSKVFYRERSNLGVERRFPEVERRWTGSGGNNKKLTASGEICGHTLSASSNKSRGALRFRITPRGGSEAEPGLELNDTAGQPAR